jgi:hypothetical protein
MKTPYSILIAIVGLFLFAPLAVANPPSWDNQINSPKRFKVLSEFSNAAVLDKETGLVWEQSPLHPDGEETGTRTWIPAQADCNVKIVGNRKGWRLPTVQELATLLDPSNPGGNPDLPVGHPFSNVQSSFYWSATSNVELPASAWTVDFSEADNPVGGIGGITKNVPLFVWCVRGGQGVDLQ